MMKVFLFVIEGIIKKHHKPTTVNTNDAKRYDNALVDVYYRWNQMYLYSQRELFTETDLEKFEV